MTFALPHRHRWLCCGLAALCVALPAAARTDSFDPAQSRFGFELRTRWGKKLEGLFPRHESEVKRLPDGHRQVRLSMSTGDVQIEGHRRYTEWTRGVRFFDAQRYPAVVFVSQPYTEALLHQGGPLAGQLSIRGITRNETLSVAPATCAQPGRECDVVVTGTVRRSDYGMDDWQMAVSDRVVFVLRARLKPQAAP